MVIKYKVEKSFTDKYTKKSIFANSIIDVDIHRMKELNEKNVGRVVDIIEEIQEGQEFKKSPKDPETDKNENENETGNAKADNSKSEGSNTKEVYTSEQLEAMKVNELKDLAEKQGYELTKATKKEIIEEILELQEK